MYIVKDLVPDLTQFYKQYKSIQPWLQSNNPPAQGEFQSASASLPRDAAFYSFRATSFRFTRSGHFIPMSLRGRVEPVSRRSVHIEVTLTSFY